MWIGVELWAYWSIYQNYRKFPEGRTFYDRNLDQLCTIGRNARTHGSGYRGMAHRELKSPIESPANDESFRMIRCSQLGFCVEVGG